MYRIIKLAVKLFFDLRRVINLDWGKLTDV